MQNIDVRFNATSNFGKVKADLAALQAQAASLGSVFQKGAYAKPPNLVADPKAWRESSRAVHEASRVYRDAASSSGLLSTQQIRSASAAEQYTKALQKQKLSFRDMAKHRGIMKEVYRDQLRFQRMSAQYWGTDRAGRAITDIAVPKNVPRDLDTMRRRMGMFGNMAASAGTQVLNMGKNIQWAGRQLMVGFTYPLALFGAAAGVMAYKVENAFASINKVYDVSAAALENQTIREKELSENRIASMKMAKDVAEQYGITVEKTLEVEQALAATGMTGQKLLDSTKEIQRISAIGDIDPSQTTDMVVALQTAFKDTIKDGNDLTNVLNFMNATSNATSLSLQDIAEATPRAASGLSQLGVTAEQMTIMLVAMREAGVQADEGANALKSATTRILNPAIVEKAQSLYKKAGAQFNLKEMVDESQGNLYKFIRLLGKATNEAEGMSRKEKAAGVAALFGTYQFNRLNAAIVNVGDARAGDNNQTAKAIQLQQKSNDELANQAKISEDLMMNNPAGKLRKAWALFQIELSTLGDPFLAAVTKILGAGTKLLGWFNKLDEGTKKWAMYGAAALALAGPIIMLSGLFLNLFGHFVKGVGSIAKFIGISKLLTKEEQASALTAEAQNKAMLTQQSTTSTLAKEVQILAEAYRQATIAAKQYISTTAQANQKLVGAPINPNTGKPFPSPTTVQTLSNIRSLQYQPGLIGPQKPSYGAYTMTHAEQQYFNQTSKQGPTGQFLSNQVRLEQARNKMAYDYMKANNQVARDATTQQKAMAAQARTQAKMKESLKGSGIAMGAMAGAAGLMMLDINKTTNSIAKWVMIGTLIVPALTMAVGAANTLAVATWKGATGAWANFAGTTATAGATTAVATGWGVATGAVKGFGIALNTALGPIGWIVLGITAIGAGLYMIHKHNEKIKEEQRQQAQSQADLVNLTDQWAESSGKVLNNYKQYASISAKQADRTAFQTAQEFYLQDEQKPEIQAYNDLNDDQKASHNTLMYIDLIKKVGLNTKQAKIQMTAFLTATGMGMFEAQLKAEKLVKRLGDLKKLDWRKEVNAATENLYNSTAELEQGNKQKIEALGKQAGGIYNEAFLSASKPEDANAIYQDLRANVLGPWEKIRQDMIASGRFEKDDPMLKDAMALRQAYLSMNEEQRKSVFTWNTMKQSGSDTVNVLVDRIFKSAQNAEALERALIAGIASAGGLGDKVDTLGEYLQQAVVMANMLTFKEAQDNARGVMKELLATVDAFQMASLEFGGKKYTKRDVFKLVDPKEIEDAEIALDALADANNIKRGSDALETFWNIIHGIKKEAKGAEDDVKKVGDAVDSLHDKDLTIRIKQVGDVVQTAMSGVQEDMAQSASDAFDSRWDTKMDNAQTMWDNRQDALQASQDRAQRALDNSQERATQAFDDRWERRKDAINSVYEKRIDHIQREIAAEQHADEVRQRLFEREKARLAQIAEMENANIDFQTAITEGRLDDAAKTLNNAGVSGANAIMDAEQANAEARTQAKIDALEKKNERLEKQRDKELKHMEKLEERMRRHLERVQDAQRRALEKQQAREQKALEKSEEAAMKSMEDKRDYEKAMLDERLELFKAYTARNQKDLERWMKKVGLTYDDFGTDVKAKGEAWSKYFQTSLSNHIRQAGVEVANDNRWEDVGKRIAGKLLKGLGFENLAEFNRFIRTGSKAGGGKGDNTETRHEGGEIGSGVGSRGSIPNAYKGLHRTEKMVRAQKGEYMINKKAYAKNKDIVQAINNEGFIPEKGIFGGAADMVAPQLVPNAGYGGPAAFMEGAIVNMFKMGLSKAFDNAYAVGAAKASAQGGSFKGLAGTYGGRFFSKEQMRNAATIASVGSGMGMNSRDIEIGIMTAIAESGLVNIHGGDRDSQGLFQQRPSMGWGTVAQVTDPEYAARKFFSVLRDHTERGAEAPWLAAQHVQRSAFEDGSNYHVWWQAAQAIFDKGLKKMKGGTSAGYIPGVGGKHRPVAGPAGSIHDSYTGFPAVDIDIPNYPAPGSHPNIHAAADGVVSRSEDLRGNDGRVSNGGYYSYGRVIQIDHGPFETLYAHLNNRFVTKGQQVKGGAVIGAGGNTGHSYGDHLHFGVSAGGPSPYSFLRTGGRIRYDNTPILGHRGETMLDASLTKKFRENVAGGGGDTFEVTIDMRGATISKDVDIERAVNHAIDHREKKRGLKRKVH